MKALWVNREKLERKRVRERERGGTDRVVWVVEDGIWSV